MESANHGSQVLHVRDDSDSQMEQLFDVLKQRPPQAVHTPFRDRNLPKSFFEQPSRLSHSRESSQDSTTNLAPAGVGLAGRAGPVSHPGIAIHHGRSQSSPAQLPVTLSAAPPQPPQPQHNKQNSMDFVEGMGQLHIPPGPATNWDTLKTGQQRCFTGTQEQTSWPKSVSTNTLNTVNVPGSHTPQGTLSPAQSHPSSPSVSVQNLGPLPRGWEQGVTPDGEIYYINHIEKTTSWFDPRIPKHLQRPGPVKVGQPQPAAPQSAAAQLLTIQPQQGLPTIATNPQTLPSTLSQPPQISPPQPAQQQPQPPQSTTQPQPQPAPQPQPPPPQQPQQQQARPPQARPQQPAVSQAGSSSSGSNSQNPQLIQFELERLKQEKDRLHREQAEIMKRELLLKEMMSKPTPQLETQHTGPTMPPTSIQSVSTSGIDPFLGQGSTNMEAHARQNSGDSGLGGMGTSYSLPRTPEDFLSNVDEMDTQDAGIKQLLKPQGSDFNMNDLQNNVCMDMGSLGDQEQSGMESEDLVSSLQEDISNLSSDLLNDVDVAKMDNLLWL